MKQGDWAACKAAGTTLSSLWDLQEGFMAEDDLAAGDDDYERDRDADDDFKNARDLSIFAQQAAAREQAGPSSSSAEQGPSSSHASPGAATLRSVSRLDFPAAAPSILCGHLVSTMTRQASFAAQVFS